MYVITHHHDYDEVLLGPIEWNPRFIASVLQSDLDLSSRPVITQEDKDKVPYNILPNVRIRPVNTVNEEYNPKTQFLIGPYWSYTDDEATATYVATYKDMDIIRAELKQQLVNERYKKEISGIKVTIQEKEVTVDTSRENRNIYVQRYVTMNDLETIEWKFPEGWFTLTKEELGSVVTACNNHVQSAFNWELQKSIAIDSATNHDELDLIEVVEKIITTDVEQVPTE